MTDAEKIAVLVEALHRVRKVAHKSIDKTEGSETALGRRLEHVYLSAGFALEKTGELKRDDSA